MIGEYVMMQANCEGREVVDDGIGMAAYTMDSHNCERIVVNGMVKNEGNVEIGGFGPYPISYRSIIPKKAECKNLYSPVCLSATHIAYGSIRMEPVFMELAQSASVAACMAIDAKQTVQEVEVRKLQAFLKQDPLLDGKTADVVTDNDDSAHVKITGEWKRIPTGGYGPSYLIATPSDSGKRIEFKPEIRVPGTYALYAYIPEIDSAAIRMQFTIATGGISKNVFSINFRFQVAGQTSGEWMSLGKIQIAIREGKQVTVTNKNANGRVVADAILLSPEIMNNMLHFFR